MHGFRSVVAPNAMVTSPHHLATMSGLEILNRGGNAIEAAITVASVIAVVYPHMNSIGGDNFWLVFDSKSGEIKSLQACGAAGFLCTPELYRNKGHEQIPFRGVVAANTVPGAVDGWYEAYKYSKTQLNGKMTFGELLAPAISYAQKGFPVTHGQYVWTKKNIGPTSSPFGHLEQFQGFASTFLKSSGEPYLPGERLTLPELAETLKVIAEGGSDAFYRGPIAKRVADYLAEVGGVLTIDDFNAHRSRWDNPISVQYREWEVFNSPPPTQGLTSLQILSMLENYPIDQWGDQSWQYYHTIIEATKRAFQDRDQWIADPDFLNIPVNQLLSRAYTQQMAKGIAPDLANSALVSEPGGGDTVWFGVVDSEGNAVSLIQSTFFDFGSGIVVDGTGILLQNRGASFSLQDSSTNVIAPGKRPFHTLNPAMALREGRPELVYGTMGGEGQPQTQAAILTRILDLKMNVQAAIDAPRWLYGRTWGEPSSSLSVEGRMSTEVIQQLRNRGHDVRIVDDWDDKMGHAQAIWIDSENGMLHGGADVRGDGLAAGF